MAAGIKIYENDIPILRERLNTLIPSGPKDKRLKPSIAIDDTLELSEIDMKLLRQCHIMEPCGSGNPRPMFTAQDVTALEVLPCGADGKHLRVRLGQNNSIMDAIGFGLGSIWQPADLLDKNLDIVFSIKEDNFRNKRSIKLQLSDLKTSD